MRGQGRLIQAAGIGPGEGPTVRLVAIVFAVLEAGRALGDAGVNTLVLRLPDDALPILYIALGAIMLVVALAFGAALGRIARGRLLGTTLVALAAAILVERVALATGEAAVIPVAWLTVTATGLLSFTIAWTVAASTFDARQAKRLFSVCTAAAIVGNFVGGIATGPIAALVGTESLIVAQAILLGLAAVAIVRLASLGVGSGWRPSTGPPRSIAADLRVGFDGVRESPLMRLEAVAFVLFAILAFSISYPFLLTLRSQFPVEAERAAAYGALTALVAAASLVLALVVANRFYARFGVATAALVLPLVYMAGFGLWIATFTFATAATVVVVQQSTQRGLSNAAWGAFNNVVPAARRSQVMVFQDGVPGQVGTILSGILLLAAGRLLAPDQVFWLGLAAAAILAVVVVAIRRRYADSLLRTLRSGAGEQVLEGGPGALDLGATAEVRSTLIRALADPAPATRSMAAMLLAGSTDPEARTALEGALDDPDPRVRGRAVTAVLGDPSGAGPAADRAEAGLRALLSDEVDPAARATGLEALARLGRTLDPEAVVAFTTDEAAIVRTASMALVGARVDDASDGILVAALHDQATTVRTAAAGVLAGRSVLPTGVTATLQDGEPAAQAAALLAMHGHPEVTGTVQTWAEARVERATALADAAATLRDGTSAERAEQGPAGDRPDALDDFLVAVLASRVRCHQDLALDAMAVLGAPAARGVIRRCLRSDDTDVRAQAIEALDSIGDRRLGAALTRLVEHAPSTAGARRDETVRTLRHDDDPWIRGLAQRIGIDGDEPLEPQITPPSPVDRPERLDALDTMLLLRRVPLFEGLDPEDLQRVAMVATERWFDADEALIRQGDAGHELFVLLDGRVRVVVSADGAEDRFVRTYESGDHIGELAVLRERPRAATVVADGGPVRALVLDGEALTAILRERPDAAMAMLTTLAERLGSQT